MRRNSLIPITICLLFFAQAVFAQAPEQNKSLDLKLNYEQGILKLSEITLVDLPAPDRRVQPQNGWRCDIVSADGSIVDSFKFAVPSVVCQDQSSSQGLEGGCTDGQKANFTLNVPFYAKGVAINIYAPNDNLALIANTIEFANLCSDNICEANENFITCPADCRSGIKDGVCDGVKDGVCDYDCKNNQDPDCKPTITAGSAFWLALMIIVILGLAGLAVWQNKRK